MDSDTNYLSLPRATYNAQELVIKNALPELHVNKAILYKMVCPSDTKHEGELVVAQYHQMSLTEELKTKQPSFSAELNVFTYVEEEGVTWWLNFTGRRLFIAYSSSLFTQDEIQVAEHPVLAHLKEHLYATYANHPANEPNPTMARFASKACPVLIRGVERRCAIEIGRSIYGSAFADASEDDLWMATDVLRHPTRTNLICMTACSNGTGSYTLEELTDLYLTAYTAFSGARRESGDANGPISVHTGHWGCGAYGNNRIVIVLIQQQAAIDACIDRLVYHTVDSDGMQAYLKAVKKREELIGDGCVSPRLFLERLLTENYQWGESDGQ